MPAPRILRNPYAALPAILSVASSIGACVFVFALMKGILWTPLPYDETERLVLLQARNDRLAETRPFVSVADFEDWRRGATSFDGMALFHWTQIDLWGEGNVRTERVEGLTVTPEFFSVMGLSAAAGRLPETADAPGDTETLILGRPLWNRRFGSDPSVVGETIAVGSWRSLPRVGPVLYRVDGVVDGMSRFLPTSRGVGRKPVGVDDVVDFWIPIAIDESELPPRDDRGFYGAVARLEAEVSLAEARAELEAVAARLAARYPATNANWSVELVPLRESIVGAVRPALWLLFGGVVLLFAIACTNLSNLELVRTVERRRELAVKMALGASGARLVRDVVVETVGLAAWGGALGVGLAAVGLHFFPAIAPAELPRADAVHLDAGVSLFAMGLVVAAGVLAGCGPAWLLAQGGDELGLHARATHESRESRRLLRAFAAVAVGTALVLLIGAGLVHQSLSRLLGVDPGYDRENLLTLTVSLPESRYPWRRNTEFVHEILDRLRRVPDVVAVGVVRGVPGRETRIETPLFVPGLASDADLRAQIRLVNRTYFDAMGIPILAGRGFEPSDERGEIGYTRVVLVNETMAERLWPNESALGQTFHVVRRDLPPVEVVGVVSDVRYRGLEHPPGMEIYYPEALFPQAQTDLIVRTAAPPLGLARLVQEEIRAVEPEVLVSNVGTLDGVLRDTLADRRLASWLLDGFSATALLLATIGVSGVMAQSVSQRRKELGVRLALGARPGPIMGMVLTQSLALTGAGIALGLVGAFGGTRLLSRYLFAIEPTDAATYLAASVAIAALATLASLVPASSAARTDPLRLLRQD